MKSQFLSPFQKLIITSLLLSLVVFAGCGDDDDDDDAKKDIVWSLIDGKWLISNCHFSFNECDIPDSAVGSLLRQDEVTMAVSGTTLTLVNAASGKESEYQISDNTASAHETGEFELPGECTIELDLPEVEIVFETSNVFTSRKLIEFKTAGTACDDDFDTATGAAGINDWITSMPCSAEILCAGSRR